MYKRVIFLPLLLELQTKIHKITLLTLKLPTTKALQALLIYIYRSHDEVLASDPVHNPNAYNNIWQDRTPTSANSPTKTRPQEP